MRGDVKELGWSSKESQILRFRVIKQIGMSCETYEPETVLDVGCGFGDMARYVSWASMAYTGIDINPKAIKIAKSRLLLPPHCFKVADILNIKKKYDWVIASGLFSKGDNDGNKWKRETFKKLKHMYKICRKGVAVNFLSNLRDHKGRKMEDHYADPDWVIQHMVYPITHKFTLRHDYKDNDFTIYMYKEKQ